MLYCGNRTAQHYKTIPGRNIRDTADDIRRLNE